MNFSLLDAGGLVDAVGRAVDSVVTSDDERGQIKAALLAEANRAQEALAGSLTARHAADMASDSWLAKNVRPLTLAVSVGLVVVTVLVEAAGVGLPGPLADGVFGLATLTVGFYFGARGAEKAVRNWRG